jgi:hypothetical protein
MSTTYLEKIDAFRGVTRRAIDTDYRHRKGSEKKKGEIPEWKRVVPDCQSYN